MLTTDSTIELGGLHLAQTAGTSPRYRLYHISDREMIVMPYARKAHDMWECMVVATRGPRRFHHLALTDQQIAGARTTIMLQPEADPDGYARLAWMAEAFVRFPGGAMPAFSRHMVDELRQAGSVLISDVAMADHNAIARRLPTTRPVAVARLLDHLVAAGLLTRGPSLWRLTAPQHGTLP